jgi:hypothetical protein
MAAESPTQRAGRWLLLCSLHWHLFSFSTIYAHAGRKEMGKLFAGLDTFQTGEDELHVAGAATRRPSAFGRAAGAAAGALVPPHVIAPGGACACKRRLRLHCFFGLQFGCGCCELLLSAVYLDSQQSQWQRQSFEGLACTVCSPFLSYTASTQQLYTDMLQHSPCVFQENARKVIRHARRQCNI